MTRRRRTIAAIALVGVLAPVVPHICAQNSPLQELTITVTDPTGAAIPSAQMRVNAPLTAQNPPLSELATTIVDQSGAAIADANVSICMTGECLEFKADNGGSASFSVAAGHYTLTASATGFKQAEKEIEVPGTSSATLVLSVSPGAVRGDCMSFDCRPGHPVPTLSSATAVLSDEPIADLPFPLKSHRIRSSRFKDAR